MSLFNENPPGDPFRQIQGEEIPIFPLNVVLFPGMPLVLRVFEPRYLNMVAHCLASDRTFGVSLITEGPEVGGSAQVWPVGTTTYIEQVETLNEGTLAIATRGRRRFRILERLPDAPYPRARVAMIDEDEELRADPVLRNEVQELLYEYLQGFARAKGQEWGDLSMPEDDVILGYVVGAVLPCSLVEKQRLLAAESPADRLYRVAPMLRREIKRVEAGESERPEKKLKLFEPEIYLSPN